MEFKDLKFETHRFYDKQLTEELDMGNIQLQSKHTFDNGITISVLKGDMFYSNGVDTYEVAIFDNDGKMITEYFNEDIDDYVRGHLTESEVTDIIKNIQGEK